MTQQCTKVRTDAEHVGRIALQYVSSGLSVFPIRSDGSKAPATEWKPFQSQLPTKRDLFHWYEMRRLEKLGIGIVCGAISGNLEVIDFDMAILFDKWKVEIKRLAPLLMKKLVIVRTPRPGVHVCYLSDDVGHNLKLAMALNAQGKPKTLIETRGEGGYVIAPGSPASCHPTGRTYTLVGSRQLDDLSYVTSTERDIMFTVARGFGTYFPRRSSDARPFIPSAATGNRPGDLFAAKTSWPEILEPHGWSFFSSDNDDTDYWTRPGKTSGVSATTNFNDSDQLYVFSSNADPFEHACGYGKFTAYSLLEHAGDFRAAASELVRLGICAPKRKHATQRLRRATPRRATVRRVSVSRKRSNKRR